jgi:hypothetical protein
MRLPFAKRRGQQRLLQPGVVGDGAQFRRLFFQRGAAEQGDARVGALAASATPSPQSRRARRRKRR